MAYIPGTFIIHLQKARTLPEGGSRLLYVHTNHGGKHGTFFRDGQCPEFEGEEAWFLVRKPANKKALEFIEQVEGPHGP